MQKHHETTSLNNKAVVLGLVTITSANRVWVTDYSTFLSPAYSFTSIFKYCYILGQCYQCMYWVYPTVCSISRDTSKYTYIRRTSADGGRYDYCCTEMCYYFGVHAYYLLSHNYIYIHINNSNVNYIKKYILRQLYHDSYKKPIDNKITNTDVLVESEES